MLLDYVDFVVHVFSEKSRQYYDLERLWKSAKRLEPAELAAPAKRRRATTGHHRQPTKKEEGLECPPQIQLPGVLPTG